MEAKREADNVLLFMRSEGYIRLKADSTITSADLYAIYTMWCNDNTYKPLAARTVSMTLKKHADEFSLEHDNHIMSRLGKRVNGFWGIEALVTPPIYEIKHEKPYPIHPKHPLWDRWADGMDYFNFNYKRGIQ